MEIRHLITIVIILKDNLLAIQDANKVVWVLELKTVFIVLNAIQRNSF